jgi:hypothetical protein
LYFDLKKNNININLMKKIINNFEMNVLILRINL